jgi:hypothetical protein
MQIERRSETDLEKVLQELAGLIRQLATAGSLSMTAAATLRVGQSLRTPLGVASSVLARLTRDGPHRSTDLAKLESAA